MTQDNRQNLSDTLAGLSDREIEALREKLNQYLSLDPQAREDYLEDARPRYGAKSPEAELHNTMGTVTGDIERAEDE